MVTPSYFLWFTIGCTQTAGTLQIIGPAIELQPTIKLGTLQIQHWNQDRQGTLQMPQRLVKPPPGHISIWVEVPDCRQFTANLVYFTAKL
jgi:hypothetical protein